MRFSLFYIIPVFSTEWPNSNHLEVHCNHEIELDRFGQKVADHKLYNKCLVSHLISICFKVNSSTRKLVDKKWQKLVKTNWTTKLFDYMSTPHKTVLGKSWVNWSTVNTSQTYWTIICLNSERSTSSGSSKSMTYRPTINGFQKWTMLDQTSRLLSGFPKSIVISSNIRCTAWSKIFQSSFFKLWVFPGLFLGDFILFSLINW